jgi:hypothetical protein
MPSIGWFLCCILILINMISLFMMVWFINIVTLFCVMNFGFIFAC